MSIIWCRSKCVNFNSFMDIFLQYGPGGHYQNYYHGALSLSQVTVTHLKNCLPSISSTGAQSSNELQRLDCMTGYQDSSPSHDHQGNMPNWNDPQIWYSERCAHNKPGHGTISWRVYELITEIWQKFCWALALMLILIFQSSHNFAHVTIAKLSWHVQNCN